jgi:hypothetical protein
MLKKIVLVGLAILIPLGVANAKRYYKRGDQPELQTQQLHEQFTCLTDENCWCDLDVEFWQEGTACECAYGPSTRIKGRAARRSKLLVGTPYLTSG